jgi:hypothetical protein
MQGQTCLRRFWSEFWRTEKPQTQEALRLPDPIKPFEYLKVARRSACV